MRKEYYKLWKDTDKPCRFENSPFDLKLKPKLDDNGFSFDVILKREGRPMINITETEQKDNGGEPIITFHGRCLSGSATATTSTPFRQPSIRPS